MKKKEKIIVALLIAAIVGGSVAFIVWDYKRQGSYDVGSYGSAGDYTQYKTATLDGQTYSYNPRIETICYMGVDTTAGLADKDAGQADTIMLFAMNKDTGKITVINFSRDTMTTVQSYDMSGNVAGTLTQHLGYAYTFGGGGETSAKNVVWSVSRLLNGIPIDEYCATDISSISSINDMVGGVTVTVPNDDLAEMFSYMYEGNTVTLTSENVEKFVRYRDTEVDFSNNGRIQRQKAYLDAYLPALYDAIKDDPDGMWEKFQEISEDTVTSIDKNQYLKIAEIFYSMDRENIEFYTPEGEDKLGENHDEFYLDEEALFEKILEIFYEKC